MRPKGSENENWSKRESTQQEGGLDPTIAVTSLCIMVIKY